MFNSKTKFPFKHDKTINDLKYLLSYSTMYEALLNHQILSYLYYSLIKVFLEVNVVWVDVHCFLSLTYGEIGFKMANIKMYCFWLEVQSKFTQFEDLSQSFSGSLYAHSKN
jgi:hypothetical protein